MVKKSSWQSINHENKIQNMKRKFSTDQWPVKQSTWDDWSQTREITSVESQLEEPQEKISDLHNTRIFPKDFWEQLRVIASAGKTSWEEKKSNSWKGKSELKSN